MKGAAKDPASSSSSPSPSEIPNPVLLPRNLLKSTMCADHFELGTIKDDQFRVGIVPGFCLDFRRAAECKKGICIPPGTTFVYEPELGHAIYICEAGLPKHQAESVTKKKGITIYVESCGRDQIKQKISIGILTNKHSVVKPSVVLPVKFELSHSDKRKNVYFNVVELRYRPRLIKGKMANSVSNTSKTNKEMWAAEVGPSQKLEFRPTSEGKVYTLLKVFSETTSKQGIQLYVESKGSRKPLGAISEEKPSIDCEFEFRDTFQLSHSSRASAVFFWGFTISKSYELQDLTRDPSPFFPRQLPKIIVDGEYRAHQALVTKKISGAKIKRVNLVPMFVPVIRFPRAALAEFSEDGDTDAGGTTGQQNAPVELT